MQRPFSVYGPWRRAYEARVADSLIVLLAVSAAFGIYVSVYYRATDEALKCLDEGGGARVKYVDGTFCLETTGATDALAFYPGGKV